MTRAACQSAGANFAGDAEVVLDAFVLAISLLGARFRLARVENEPVRANESSSAGKRV